MDLISPVERDNLIEEYKILHDSIYRRSLTIHTVNSILLPSSIIIIGLAVEFQDRINSLFQLAINVAGLLPILSIVVLFASAFLTVTTNRIDDIAFKRVHKIECILGIKGHRYIFAKIKDSLWWKFRRVIWFLLIILAVGICVITSYYLLL
jgi:hypothetical protein